MKKTVLTLISLFTATVLAETTMKTDLGVFHVWRSAEIQGHAYSSKNACMAYTQTRDAKSTLEFYAEELANPADGYTNPTIQVIADPETPRFIRAVANDDKKLGEFHLTLQSTRTSPPVYALLARVDQRAKFTDVLRRANTLTVRLVGEKNVVVKTLTFSLRGSMRSIDAAVAGCNLIVD